jgi:hypothetical protein
MAKRVLSHLNGLIGIATDSNSNFTELYPRTGLTFAGEFDLSTSYESYYDEHTTNTTITPTVSASPKVGAGATVVINAGSSAALITTNLGTLRPSSDSFTVSKLNEIMVFNLPGGLQYSIKVLN